MVEEGTFRPKIKKPDEEISEIYTALKYFKQGEFESVISQINKALKINPALARAYNIRGSALLKLKKYGRVLYDFSKAIEINPDDPRPYFNRGLTYRALKQDQKMLRDMRKAASLGDKLALGYLPNKQLKVARQMKSSISETTMEKQENDLVSSAFRKNTPQKVSPVPLGVFFMGLGAGIGGGFGGHQKEVK